MKKKQSALPEASLNAINPKLIIKGAAMAVVVIVYLLSYYLYYSHLNKKAGEDFLFGSFLYRRGIEDTAKYEEAEKVFQDMLSSYGIRHWQELALFYIGNIHYKRYNILEAERAYNFYIYHYPGGDWAKEALLSLAYIAENRGLYEAAVEQYNKLLREFPENYLFKEAYLGIGRAYERLKKFDLSKEYYGKIEGNYPDTVWARKARERIEEIEAIIKREGG